MAFLESFRKFQVSYSRTDRAIGKAVLKRRISRHIENTKSSQLCEFFSGIVKKNCDVLVRQT